jgi:hypothetical protein
VTLSVFACCMRRVSHSGQVERYSIGLMTPRRKVEVLIRAHPPDSRSLKKIYRCKVAVLAAS